MQQVFSHVRRNVVGYLALFVALSGTSYAATTSLLPRNSVGTVQVINHSLLKQDFKAGQLPRGAIGPEGPEGPTGPAGEKGPPGITNVGHAQLTGAQVNPAARGIVSAFIPTSSSNANCLVTLNESSAATTGTTVFCGTRSYNGVFGLLIHVLSPTAWPADMTMGITVYQEAAQQYGQPVFYPDS
jgi:hypothetical protein